jgi:hypothetical protein
MENTDASRIGDSFNFKGQSYEISDSFEAEIPARVVLIHELRSCCPDCGKVFYCTASARQLRHRHLRRRCDDCCKPGVPVRFKPKSPPTHK